MATPEWIIVTLKVIQAIEALGIPYAIGGSAASIIHGAVRTTVDSDLIVDLKPEHVEPLVACLSGEFYADPASIYQAIAGRTSFNLIHQETMFKVDIFIPKSRPFDEAQLKHRVEEVIAHDGKRTAWFLSAEDIVLAKLDWFRLGNEVSERQWRDVLSVLKTQSGKLNITYMRQMAATLSISDLLEAALAESEKE